MTMPNDLDMKRLLKPFKIFIWEGKKDEAAMAVPNELVDECALIGPAERIKERLQPWKELDKSGKIGTLVLGNVSKKSSKSNCRRSIVEE